MRVARTCKDGSLPIRVGAPHRSIELEPARQRRIACHHGTTDPVLAKQVHILSEQIGISASLEQRERIRMHSAVNEDAPRGKCPHQRAAILEMIEEWVRASTDCVDQ